ncbi:MAG: rRNA maturation RNase YbeY [Candidatus Omnitrophica bacterium]|nr:rRNA maturation RNase YbeY [Candidatus Omnitrophota bacterium]
MNQLNLRSRQRVRLVDGRLLGRLVRDLLTRLLAVPGFDLGINLVAAPEMTRLNETFLHHAGSTDVITFDYSEPPGASDFSPPILVSGELFVCVDEAVAQAIRYRTDWQTELVRYIVHGILHLTGYDDKKPDSRRRMKRAEDRLLRRLRNQFSLWQLDRAIKVDV